VKNREANGKKQMEGEFEGEKAMNEFTSV